MIERYGQLLSLAGIRIDALTHTGLLQALDHAEQARDKLLIFNHNLHSLYLHEVNAAFRASYRHASYVYIDGLPVVWLGRLAGLPLTAYHRITFLDSFDSFLAEAARRGWRVFYLGSSAETLEKGLASIRKRHPHLVIEGRNGFFPKNTAGNREVIQEINSFRTDILFVGMGMPLQETWLADNHESIGAFGILTSGGTLNYFAGTAYQPPLWVGKLGLYGICRLLQEPGRLWRRYLLEPLILAKLLFSRIMQQRLGGAAVAPWSSQESEGITKNIL